MLFPMHNYMYTASVFVVGWWTISKRAPNDSLHCDCSFLAVSARPDIHDRVTLQLPLVNGAAHHTIHHTKFNYNYGQVRSLTICRQLLTRCFFC